MKKYFLCIYTLVFFLVTMINLSFAEEPCLTLNKTDLKVEAWLSKKYENKYINIKKIFI